MEFKISSQEMNILFRISGGRAINKELGLGHIYRSMNLASQLKNNNIYFLVEDYGGVIPLLIECGYRNSFPLKKRIGLDSDIKETTNLINRKKIDILIVDKYDIQTKKFVKFMRKLTKTIVIPDLKKIDYDADLVINGFIGFDNKVIKNRYGTKCLVGPAYQILNKKYEKTNYHTKKKYNILATFGGFDEHNIVDIFCQKLVNYLDKITAKIILGPVTKKTKMVESLEARYREHLEIISETKDMKKEIANAEFGICGGGITSYEFAVMGVPFAIICQYNHQIHTARAWQRRNIALNLGLPNDKTEKKLRNLLKNIADKKISIKPKRRQVVDGLGGRRAAKEILKI